MNAILSWMFSANEKSATVVSDQVGADLICELGAEDHAIAGSDDVLFHIIHIDKEFLLIQGTANFTLICSRTH
ncbi:hypothetical protein HA444_24300 [Klebsiella grimontii]|uniref:hypothetical protein n=1 Tax=Klebsiella grimontii TaxID=2058152 RepID=UPI001662F822|nr:hypothetical protein [Klebsiella grimontii]MBD0905741.1 hypothetical protein [Klebsiella grimontii]